MLTLTAPRPPFSGSDSINHEPAPVSSLEGLNDPTENISTHRQTHAIAAGSNAQLYPNKTMHVSSRLPIETVRVIIYRCTQKKQNKMLIDVNNVCANTIRPMHAPGRPFLARNAPRAPPPPPTTGRAGPDHPPSAAASPNARRRRSFPLTSPWRPRPWSSRQPPDALPPAGRGRSEPLRSSPVLKGQAGRTTL